MCSKSNEELLYECYKQLDYCLSLSTRVVPYETDRRTMKKSQKRTKALIKALNPMNDISSYKLKKILAKAKSEITSVSSINHRNPDCVSKEDLELVDRLTKLVCKHESKIALYDEDTISEKLGIMVNNLSSVRLLGTHMLEDILVVDVKPQSPFVYERDIKPILYATKSGKKYHLDNCKYCKSKDLIPISTTVIKERSLEPCSCIKESQYIIEPTITDVTVFIDESIRKNRISFCNSNNIVGTYSYIICKGSLESEKEISTENTLLKGVDFFRETVQGSRLTEAAISKVLISLLFDLKFYENVTIYTDNEGIVSCWKRFPGSFELSKQFESVYVKHIPREKNKKADALCRNTRFLCITDTEYEELVRRCNNYSKVLEELK